METTQLRYQIVLALSLETSSFHLYMLCLYHTRSLSKENRIWDQPGKDHSLPPPSIFTRLESFLFYLLRWEYWSISRDRQLSWSPFYCYHHTSWGNFQTFFNNTILKPSTAKNSSKTLDPSISHLSHLQVASRLMSSSSSSRIYLARSPTKKQTR